MISRQATIIPMIAGHLRYAVSELCIHLHGAQISLTCNMSWTCIDPMM